MAPAPQTAGRPIKVRDYAVRPAILDAIRRSPAQFRAGVLGPGAYPDIQTGPQIIHPAGWRGPDGSPHTAAPCRAFVVGYLTHAAGDIYGHTLIKRYTGDAFHF